MFDTSEHLVMLLTHNVVSNSTVGKLAGNCIFWAVGAEHQPDCIFSGDYIFLADIPCQKTMFPPGNDHIPLGKSVLVFMIFPKVGFVSFLEGNNMQILWAMVIFFMMSLFFNHDVAEEHSLKLTAQAPENRQTPTGKCMIF